MLRFQPAKITFFIFFFSFSSRKITDKKSKDSIAGDYPESCSICHKNRAAGASVGSQSAANGPLLLTSCGNCSASICTSPACAIRSANSDCWECNECHRQRLDTATGYLQAYDWIFERLNRKFSERASSAISSNKSEAERRRCCSNVMWSSNGKSICLVCFVVVAGRLIAPMLMAPSPSAQSIYLDFHCRRASDSVASAAGKNTRTRVHRRFDIVHARWQLGRCVRWTNLRKYRLWVFGWCCLLARRFIFDWYWIDSAGRSLIIAIFSSSKHHLDF